MSKEEKDLIQIIKEEVMIGMIKKVDALPGDSFNEHKISVSRIREILYSKLMDIEIRQVKEKWERY